MQETSHLPKYYYHKLNCLKKTALLPKNGSVLSIQTTATGGFSDHYGHSKDNFCQLCDKNCHIAITVHKVSEPGD
jgi:hypothetical protein